MNKTEKIIERFKNVHGDRFDYNEVEYKGINTPVKIKCKTHGIFEITPRVHLNKRNDCPKCRDRCRNGIPLTKEEVIEKFKSVHGDKFEYNDINYINDKTPILVGCKVNGHGKFKVNPNAHMFRGNDCPICKPRNKTKTKRIVKFAAKKEKFFNSLKNLQYGYDYSLVEYINHKTPIKIICKDHGIFEQTPQVHLDRYGRCPQCALVLKGQKIIKAGQEKFKTRYNYDKFVYNGSVTSSIFTCVLHGDFEMTPTAFLIAKEPCPLCRGVFGCTTEEFIEKAKKIHGDKYDYSLVKYYNSKTAVQLICQHHGTFWKNPDTFLNQGQGCPKCNKDQQISKGEIEWLNFNLVPIRSYKIDNYIVDGYNPVTNTIYEYLGDYWHGNLERYKAEDINKSNGESFGELNRKTFERINKFKEAGYIVCYVWESVWMEIKNKKD